MARLLVVVFFSVLLAGALALERAVLLLDLALVVEAFLLEVDFLAGAFALEEDLVELLFLLAVFLLLTAIESTPFIALHVE